MGKLKKTEFTKSTEFAKHNQKQYCQKWSNFKKSNTFICSSLKK